MKIKLHYIRDLMVYHADSLFLLLIYAVSALCSGKSGFLSGVLLVVGGVALYFYYSYNGEKSFLKLNAVFSASWLVSIGLANFRLLEYQVIWNVHTWILLSLTHLIFVNMNRFAIGKFSKIEKKFTLSNLLTRYPEFPFELRINSTRLFWIATIVTVTGVACFLMNVYIKGYIPYFETASNPNAYFDFYTRFHIFVVASTVSGGLSYYTLRKLSLSIAKRVLLVVYIIVIVFVLPILLVQRGTFVNTALILATVIYLMSNKKFIVLFLSVAIIFSIYLFGSSIRGYSDEQLIAFFQPREISMKSNETEAIENSDNSAEATFLISPKVAFVYSYLTVSHDNFNSAVTKNKEYSWGIRQFEPFNVILRLDTMKEELIEAKAHSQSHRVLPHLTTFNLIADAFYDFGILGVVAFVSIWSFCFGIVEEFCSKYEGIFSKLSYGVILIPVTLSFFHSWLSFFPIWMLWGTVLLMYIAASLKIRRRGINS